MTLERRGITRRGIDRRALSPRFPEPVSSWLRYVKRNHGGHVSERTLRALSKFYNKLKFQYTTLFNKILVLNPIVPDGIEAALTPLIDITQKFQWIDVGQGYRGGTGGSASLEFACLSINGICTKNTYASYINTQFNPSLYLSSTNLGVTTYVTESPGTNFDEGSAFSSCFLGCIGATNESFRFQFKAGRDWFDYPNSVQGSGGHFSNAYANNTESIWQRGFLSFNQSGSVDLGGFDFNIWKMNEDFPIFDDAFKPYGTGPSSTDPLPNYTARFLSQNSIDGPVTAGGVPSRPNDRYAFLAIHRALSSGEAANLYNLIFELRTNLGGGAIVNFH